MEKEVKESLKTFKKNYTSCYHLVLKYYNNFFILCYIRKHVIDHFQAKSAI